MGAGFTENPPPPAPDYPPENAFDIELFTSNFADALVKKGVLTKEGAIRAKTEPGWFEKELLSIIKDTGTGLAIILDVLLEVAQPFLEQLVKSASTVLDPGMRTLGFLTNAYVLQMVGQGQTRTPAGLPIPGGSQQDATATVFDQIMAPLLNLLTPSNPGAAGAGENNAQHILGTIISLHLSTWAVNIISNLTGLGYLKWINSFDDALTSGISARGFSRLASKPYLEKYVVTPLTKDLNRAWPVTIGSTSQLVKRYIRGNMTAEELKAQLRAQGFDDQVVADLLLDTVKLLPVDVLVDLVNEGALNQEQALTYLQQQGWPKDVVPAVYFFERYSRVRAQRYSLASSLVDAFIDRRLDNPTLRLLLKQAGLPPEEIDAYATRGAILQELSRRLNLSQVKALFAEDLVDLDYVMRFLTDEGYSEQDVDLLALLEFTRKDDREQRKADLLERRRIALEAQLGFEDEADRARAAELATLGGPTP